MFQKSRTASPSDVRALRQQSRAGGPSRPAQAVAKHLMAGVLLAGAIHALPLLFGPGFYQKQFDGAMAFAAAAGQRARTALVVAFESIPVVR